MTEVEFISSTAFPYTGVGNLEVPFNTFRLGRKWTDRLEKLSEEDPHMDAVFVHTKIDGDVMPDIDLKIVGWAYGPFDKMAEKFGADNHGWRNTKQDLSPRAWLADRLAEIYGEHIGPWAPVTVLFFEPVTQAEKDDWDIATAPDDEDED